MKLGVDKSETSSNLQQKLIYSSAIKRLTYLSFQFKQLSNSILRKICNLRDFLHQPLKSSNWRLSSRHYFQKGNHSHSFLFCFRLNSLPVKVSYSHLPDIPKVEESDMISLFKRSHPVLNHPANCVILPSFSGKLFLLN